MEGRIRVKHKGAVVYEGDNIQKAQWTNDDHDQNSYNKGSSARSTMYVHDGYSWEKQ